MTEPGEPRGWMQVLSRWPWVLTLVITLWALAYLPALGVRDLRLEEGRRATPAAEMYYGSDWIVPRLYGQPYLNKPPMFFWICGVVGALQGELNELSVRIPSVAAVLLGALLMLAFARHQLPLRTRALGALFLLATPLMLDKGTLGEIDAVLSTMTFAAVVSLWEFYDEARGRFRWPGWILAGLFLAMATLTKGPGGLIQFYAMLVPFLLFSARGRWRQLFSLGHLLMLFLALIPGVLWVIALLSRTHLTLDSLLALWKTQTGVNSFTGQSLGQRFERYAEYPWRVISDSLPWSLFAVLSLFPAFRKRVLLATPAAPPRAAAYNDLLCFLTFALPTLTLIFWAWPSGSPRYQMMGVFPVAMLASIAVFSLCELPQKPSLLQLLNNIASVLPVVWTVGSIAACIAAWIWIPQARGWTVFTLCGCLIAGHFAFRLARRGALIHAPVAAACALALLITLGRGIIASAVFPKLAESDATRLLHKQMSDLVPPENDVYTTRTFGSLRGASYYNIQFYLPRGTVGRPTALDDYTDLPVGKKVTVVLGKDEWDKLIAVAPNARQLGVLATPKGPPPLIVAEVTR